MSKKKRKQSVPSKISAPAAPLSWIDRNHKHIEQWERMGVPHALLVLAVTFSLWDVLPQLFGKLNAFQWGIHGVLGVAMIWLATEKNWLLAWMAGFMWVLMAMIENTLPAGAAL